jgi:hypothetical protein
MCYGVAVAGRASPLINSILKIRWKIDRIGPTEGIARGSYMLLHHIDRSMAWLLDFHQKLMSRTFQAVVCLLVGAPPAGTPKMFCRNEAAA